MSTNVDAKIIHQAATQIIEQYYRGHKQQATDAMMRAVYVSYTPAPTENAAPATLITERVLSEAITAEATYHDREAARFKDALDLLESMADEYNDEPAGDDE